MSSILQDPGSFRDPLSKVFVGDGKVVRAFTEMGASDIDKVWKKKSMYGREYMGIERSAFLIDEKGKILHAWYKISPKDTPTFLLEALEK